MGACVSTEEGQTASIVAVDAQKQQDTPCDKPSYKKNQVVPTTDSDATKDQHPTATSTDTPLTRWQSKKAVTKKTSQSLVQDLQDLGSQVQSDRTAVASHCNKMRGILRAAPAWIDMATSASHAEAAEMLEACSKAACDFANHVLQPIVSHAERTLTHKTASSSHSSATAFGTWDTLEIDQVLEALQDACMAEYGMELAAAVEPAKMASELLVMLHHRTKHLHSSVVPALSKVASMVGIVFFRRVVLESPEGLAAKMDQLGQLRAALGWPDNLHLAVCLEPHARAMLAGLHQAFNNGGERRINFQVSRHAAFWDALRHAQEQQGLLPADGKASSSSSSSSAAQPQCSSGRPQCYKVFPSFVDEWASGAAGGPSGSVKVSVEAGEGHGPRKEFFLLAASNMTGQQISSSTLEGAVQPLQGGDRQQRPNLFVFNRSAGSFWYNTTLAPSSELQYAYRFAGWLFGQSLLNKAPLGLPLAPVMMQHLLQGVDTFCPSLQTLEAFDPDAAVSIRHVAALAQDQLQGMLELEGLPQDTTAEQYTQHAVHSLLVGAVEWQARALVAGFQAAADLSVLRTWCIDAAVLAAVLEGGEGAAGANSDINIQQTYRVVMDGELTANGGVLGKLFWEVIGSWPRDRKLQFLQFVTGSSRLPLPGSELLKIEAPFVALGLAEHKAQLGMLPQAHTCDNLLELPNYWDALLQVKGYRSAPPDQMASLKEECARILNDRLTLAVTCSSGYGLDQRAVDADD